MMSMQSVIVNTHTLSLTHIHHFMCRFARSAALARRPAPKASAACANKSDGPPGRTSRRPQLKNALELHRRRPDQLPIVAAAGATRAVPLQLLLGAEASAGSLADGFRIGKGLVAVAAIHAAVRLRPRTAVPTLCPAVDGRVGAAAHLVQGIGSRALAGAAAAPATPEVPAQQP